MIRATSLLIDFDRNAFAHSKNVDTRAYETQFSTKRLFCPNFLTSIVCPPSCEQRQVHFFDLAKGIYEHVLVKRKTKILSMSYVDQFLRKRSADHYFGKPVPLKTSVEVTKSISVICLIFPKNEFIVDMICRGQ